MKRIYLEKCDVCGCTASVTFADSNNELKDQGHFTICRACLSAVWAQLILNPRNDTLISQVNSPRNIEPEAQS